MISLNETLQDLKNSNVSCHHTYIFRKRWSVGDGVYESGDKIWWEEWECSQCGKRHKFPKDVADPDKEPESELYPEITFANKMISLGNDMIKFIRDKCEHKYKIIERGSSGGGYEAKHYWKKERCVYCDHQRYVDQ